MRPVRIIWNYSEVRKMESELSRFEIAPGGIVNSESTDIFSSAGRQQLINASTSIPTASLTETTPRIPTVSDNQLMSNYISSPHPDLPNQYNIIIADDDDEEDEDDVISQTLSSPQPQALDIQHHSMGATPYRSYTVQFKLNTLDWYYRNGENKNLAAKMFSVDRKRIRDWLQDEKNLRSDPNPERTKRKRTCSLPQYKDIEDALYQFYVAQREKGIKPKNAELRAKSLEFASVLGYRENTFKASIHWLCNWKRRNNISFAGQEHIANNNTTEEDDDSAAQPFLDDHLGKFDRPSQPYKGGRAGFVGTGVDGAGGSVAGSSSGNGSVGYGVESLAVARSTSGAILGAGVVDSIPGLAVPRTASTGGGRVYAGGLGMDGLSVPRSTGGGGGGCNAMDGLGRRRDAHHQDLVEEANTHTMTGPSCAGMDYNSIALQPPAKEHDASEQWMELLEQSVLTLESDVARRFSQIKLLLQQIKKSRPHQHNNSPLPPNAMPSHNPPTRLTPLARTQNNK